MTLLPPAQAEDTLRHLAQQFAQWRQSRTTPRGRIPQPRWAQARARAHGLPLARVAKQLGLTSQALKRRSEGRTAASVPTPLPASLNFVEVTPPAWRAPTAEVEVQRADGARLRLTYHEATPALAPLLQAFLASRCCSNSPRKAASWSRGPPSISVKGLMALPPSVVKRSGKILWAARSTSAATARARRSNSWSTTARDSGSAPNASPRAAFRGGPPLPPPACASLPGN